MHFTQPAPGTQPSRFSQPSPPVSVTPSTALSSVPRKPHILELGKCRGFFLQWFIYSTDYSKVTYVMMLLRETMLAWATVVWVNQPNICSSFTSFITEMTQDFDHPVQGKDPAKYLIILTHGSCSIGDYLVVFRTLAGDLVTEMMSWFRVRWLRQPRFLILLIVQVGQSPLGVRELIIYKSLPLLGSSHCKNKPLSPFSTQSSCQPFCSNYLGEEHMQLGQFCLFPTKCLCRAGECLYCAQFRHFQQICPFQVKLGSTPVAAEIHLSIPSCNPECCFKLLCLNQQFLPFLCRGEYPRWKPFSQSWHFLWAMLYTLDAIDWTEDLDFYYHTRSFPLFLSNNHHEQLRFILIFSPQALVTLPPLVKTS